MTVELVREPREWWQDLKEIARLGRYLEEQGQFRTSEERWTFVEKLQSRHESWTPDFEAMVREEREELQDHLFEEERAYESERRYAP